jgi:hypothetical protein
MSTSLYPRVHQAVAIASSHGRAAPEHQGLRRVMVVRSDLMTGPWLPQTLVFALVEFCGVPDKQLRFLRHSSRRWSLCKVALEDKPTCACGVLVSYVLSDALSEAVLFCLDFAINQRIDGRNVCRFQDDLWLWGQQPTCTLAFHVLLELLDMMGP